MSKIAIGETFYLIYYNGITEETVYLIGEERFCHQNAFNGNFRWDYRAPLSYDGEGIRWFRTLKDAKDYLKRDTDCIGIKKIEEGYWEAVWE